MKVYLTIFEQNMNEGINWKFWYILMKKERCITDGDFI